jgi:hypothetical protein
VIRIIFSPAHTTSSQLVICGFAFFDFVELPLDGCSAAAVVAANFLRAARLTCGKEVDMIKERS